MKETTQQNTQLPILSRYFKVSIAFTICLIAILTLPKINQTENAYILFTAGFAVLIFNLLISFAIKNNLFVIPNTLTIIGLWISLSIRLNFETYSQTSLFELGFLICLLQAITISSLHKKSWIIAYSIIFIGIRAINFYEWNQIIAQVALESALLAIMLEKYRDIDSKVKEISSQTSKYAALRDIIECYCTQPILLITKDLEVVLYRNTKYLTVFGSKSELSHMMLNGENTESLRNYILGSSKKKELNQKLELSYKKNQLIDNYIVNLMHINFGKQDGILLAFEEKLLPDEKQEKNENNLIKAFDSSIDSIYNVLREFISVPSQSRQVAKQLICNYFAIMSKMIYSLDSFVLSINFTLKPEKAIVDVPALVKGLISNLDFYLKPKNSEVEFKMSEGLPQKLILDKQVFSEIITLILLSFTRRIVNKLYLHCFMDAEDLCFIISGEQDTEMQIPRVRVPLFIQEHPFQFMLDSENIAYAGRIANNLLQQINSVSNEGISRYGQNQFFFMIENARGAGTIHDLEKVKSLDRIELSIGGIEDENPNLSSKAPVSSRFKTPAGTERELNLASGFLLVESNRKSLFDSNLSTTSRNVQMERDYNFLIVDSDKKNTDKINLLGKLKKINVQILSTTKDVVTAILNMKKFGDRFDLILIRCDKTFSSGAGLCKRLALLMEKKEIPNSIIVGMASEDGMMSKERWNENMISKVYKIPFTEEYISDMIFMSKYNVNSGE